MVILIRNGLLKPNDPNSLSELSGGITLTDNWDRRVLKSRDCVKRKETTGKVAPSTQFLAEVKFKSRKTKRYLRNFQFPCTFQIYYTEDYWYNQTKAIEHFVKGYFSIFGKNKSVKGLP